ncbi:Zinc finger BED domain-containing protein 4 [Labeo rohita]|uniref:Zinc finger BED domain-containing protein 4 n=1 Tax=Labeo rohita TaxID=84645 RepID=A0ABQ8L9L2_LABRO|nr:Zinc finger BED domain-containing protein 4 [Labeo rohita]
MHGSHTGEYIKNTLLHTLEEWKITKDCVGLVLQNNGTNKVKGLRLANIPDFSCTAPSLQLVVNHRFASQRAMIDVIAMLKKCVTHFQHSILAKQHLRNIQKDIGLPEYNLIQTVPTRALEQKRALNIYSAEHGGFTCPAAHQWDIVSNLVETLIPIEEVTLEVSYSNSPAFSIQSY